MAKHTQWVLPLGCKIQIDCDQRLLSLGEAAVV